MARLVLCAFALLVAGGSCDPLKKTWPQKPADPATLKRQVDLSTLFYHIHEPLHYEPLKTIASTWEIEKNIEHYSNVTACKIYVDLMEYGLLPRSVPFSMLDEHHQFEAETLFHVLFSAKHYDTFYKTAVYLRDRVNENLYVYVLTTAILHRHDTQGFVVPALYEIFPSYFFNGEVMTTAQRINTHGMHMIEHYPTTYIWNDNVVIRWNETVWPYFSVDSPVFYWTHDYALNTWYYNSQVAYPKWLGSETCPLVKDNRGEFFWYWHKQLLARYYMERLSNGLGEIPDLELHGIVEEGYTPGLLYHNGIPFPVRPNHFHLHQEHFIHETKAIYDMERRIRDAIDAGYYINNLGEHVSLRNPECIDVLGRLIEANADSPNTGYYQDFITLWKELLGNSIVHEHAYHQTTVPLVLPSALEQYQTALRDPAFYMIWKRVLNLFDLWHQQLPLYKPEELAFPAVTIHKVETDKLVTYFEHTYVNVTNHLHMNDFERKVVVDDVSVLVQVPRLNHKVFQVRVNVKSEVAKTVLVKFFLAPKYDSHGYEIPLHLNTENFFQIDQFTYDLPVGEHVIKRDSSQNTWTIEDWTSAHEVYEKAENALHGKGQFILSQSQKIEGYPDRLLLPKGRIGGMPFVLLTYISEYHAPKVQQGTGFDHVVSPGFGSGARRMSDEPIGFPVNRPLHHWQIEHLHNIMLQDVLIHHKPTPEVYVPHTDTAN
ncbi:acidic juvenile hormone-suppressible protein 1-like [Leguminivora glycinivorella]|uniref:acidic juvenile hormone-suppressible protein 1-like n=1 Tax=Leguminivora glycinivorella TaxID=1035111 RepID=UPI00200CA345|nr:acidic juvenile hormone-suppressible protein 1-like [Leguminivora glycinivorella]